MANPVYNQEVFLTTVGGPRTTRTRTDVGLLKAVADRLVSLGHRILCQPVLIIVRNSQRWSCLSLHYLGGGWRPRSFCLLQPFGTQHQLKFMPPASKFETLHSLFLSELSLALWAVGMALLRRRTCARSSRHRWQRPGMRASTPISPPSSSGARGNDNRSSPGGPNGGMRWFFPSPGIRRPSPANGTTNPINPPSPLSSHCAPVPNFFLLVLFFEPPIRFFPTPSRDVDDNGPILPWCCVRKLDF